MDLPTDEFARAMSDVLLTGKGANLVVTCGDIIWKVHNKVLEGRSRYCQALLKTDAVVRTHSILLHLKLHTKSSRQMSPTAKVYPVTLQVKMRY